MERKAARIIALDPSHRILLLQYARTNGETFWATPGGGLEDGETFEAAANREVAEELGVSSVALEPLWEASAEFHAGGRLIHQVERFFLLRIDPLLATADVEKAQQLEGILQTRWWTLSDLQCAKEPIFPEDLALRVAGLLTTSAG